MGKTETETINPRHGAHQRKTTMLRKLTLALVAAASLSAMALAPTAASAGGGGKWGGGFGWNHHHWGHGYGIGFVGGGYGGYDGCYQTRRVMTDFGPRFRVVNVCAY
jgi:hypothetical protein